MQFFGFIIRSKISSLLYRIKGLHYGDFSQKVGNGNSHNRILFYLVILVHQAIAISHQEKNTVSVKY
jgi:hypothetical protein